MNRVAISLAIVAVCVGVVASAARQTGHKGEEFEFEGPRHEGRLHDELEFEGRPGGFRHPGRICNDGDCLGPGPRRPIGPKGGKNFARSGHGKRNIARRGGHVGGAGIGAAGAAGALGDIRAHEGQAAHIDSNTRLGEHDLVEGHKGFAAGEKKGIRAGLGSHIANEDEGIHKHQVLNRDKTIIKDRTSGVNDVDGFRHASENSHGAGFEAGEGKFLGAGAEGLSDRNTRFNNRFQAGEESEGDFEAGGAIGGVAGTGAGFGGASF